MFNIAILGELGMERKTSDGVGPHLLIYWSCVTLVILEFRSMLPKFSH